MKLTLAVACEDARVRPDGKIDVSGIFNELYAPGFPALQDRLTVVFVMEWESGEAGRQPLRADLLDPSGRAALTIQGHTDVAARDDGAPSAQTQLIMPLENVIFPTGGRYTFQIRIGAGPARPAFTLFVGEQRHGGGGGPTAGVPGSSVGSQEGLREPDR